MRALHCSDAWEHHRRQRARRRLALHGRAAGAAAATAAAAPLQPTLPAAGSESLLPSAVDAVAQTPSPRASGSPGSLAIPCTPAVLAATAAASPPPAPALAAEEASAPRLRVLLVDDHRLNLRLCKRLLETQGGMDVVTADDGDVALQLLQDSYADGGGACAPVDFVLMDLQARALHDRSDLLAISVRDCWR
jgi:hypothetical protein